MVITLVSLAIITGYTAAFKSINLAKEKMVAVSLANEKMEILRNIAYDDLATVSGTYPPGNILDNEIIERNGLNFDVHTVISYVDDPADGNVGGTIPGKPADIYPYDYKKVEITVGRVGKNSQLAKLVTNVSAKAAETETNTGILNFCVIDASSNPVPDASVSITNTTLLPPLSISVTTGAEGCVMVPKLPPDEHNNYHVLVTKDGYSQSSTYPRTSQNPNALIPDVNIIVQQVTSVTLVIDQLSSMTLSFVDQAGNPVPNVHFSLESSKMIYNNPDTFKFKQSYTADGAGVITIPNLEFDNYKLIEISPMYLASVSTTQPIALAARANLPVQVVLASSSSNPSIYNLSPKTGTKGDITSVIIDGGNFSSGLNVNLVNVANNLTINGTNIDVSPHNKIVVDFDLTNAVPGVWDLVVTNSNGETVTQKDAFSVVGN